MNKIGTCFNLNNHNCKFTLRKTKTKNIKHLTLNKYDNKL